MSQDWFPVPTRRFPAFLLLRKWLVFSFVAGCLTLVWVPRSHADQPFSWQSVSFDGGPAFLLGGSVTGFLNGKPVESTNLLDLENNGMMFHVRWGSYVLPHLGLRFSVGYETFSANRGFSGLSGMPLTIGATVPLWDPRAVERRIIPYFAADLGPSFNSLSTNSGNAGSVSFTADAGAGVMYRINDQFSLYGEAVGTYIDSPISTRGLASSSSNLSSGPLWTLPVVFGVTYEFRTPGSAPSS